MVGRYNSGESVQCHTDLATRCRVYIYCGDWYFLDGDRLPFTGDSDIFEFRGSQRVARATS